MTTEFIITGLIGASPGSVGIFPILLTASMLEVTLRNTLVLAGARGPTSTSQEIVVNRVDEELRAAAVGLAGVGHGQGAGLVGGLVDELVGDVAAGVALDGLPVAGEGRAALGTAGHTGLGVRRRGGSRTGA